MKRNTPQIVFVAIVILLAMAAIKPIFSTLHTPKVIKEDSKYIYVAYPTWWQQVSHDVKEPKVVRYKQPVTRVVEFYSYRHKNHKLRVDKKKYGVYKVTVPQNIDRCAVISEAAVRLHSGKNKVLVTETFWPHHEMMFIRFVD